MRFAGFRCPSEINALLYDNIDWGKCRIKIWDTKRKRYRFPPIFPEVKALLYKVCCNLPAGSKHVLKHKSNVDYRRAFLDVRHDGRSSIIKKAGLETWPNLFNNLRKSCVIDLKRVHPSHVVDDWIGHTSGVSEEFYCHTIESHYDAVNSQASRLPKPSDDISEGLVENVEVTHG